MLLNNKYLKNYLLSVKLLNEKNFFFIIENLCNINIYLFKIKFFYIFKKNKLSHFFLKGKTER